METSHFDTNNGPNFIVLSPLCERFRKWKKDTQFRDNTVHRDLRKWNLLRDRDGNIHIADWGFVVEKYKLTFFAGSLKTLSNKALQNVIAEKEIKCHSNFRKHKKTFKNFNISIDFLCKTIL